MKTHTRRIIKCVSSVVASLVLAGSLLAADLEMEFKVQKGTGDSPMVVVWLEDDEGNFVKTIQMFSKNKKYYKQLLAWKLKSRMKDLDGVTGATIKWDKAKTITVPADADGVNLLEGKYVLRIESRKDKGKHYRNFEIPLTKDYKGGVHKNEGYVEQVTVTLK